MNEFTDKPESEDIPQPTPPQGPTPLTNPSDAQEPTPTPPPIPQEPVTPPLEPTPAAEPVQETAPPPEFDASAPPIPPQSEPQGQTPPPPVMGELSKDEKMWGMFCHLAALAGFVGVPFGNILGPLILWLIKKDEMPFIDDQGKEALNFQISLTIYGLALLPTFCFPPLMIILALALSIANIVFIIIAALKANNGEAYRYPCCLRLVK